jgi:molybdopterin/thiamine biosynthesis adenylyltransferase
MQKVKVIGCGGIGSYFAQHIERLIDLKQISDMKFTFYDDDIVELKNILYQNFETSDIDSNKTDALATKFFNINFDTKRLDLEDLKESDLIILCADNNKIRKEAWEAWTKYNIKFIDSRANGRAIGIFSSDTENYIKTISDSDKPSSCQNPFQIAKKEIEYGNVVIASALAQVVLNYSRSKRLPPDFMINL